MLTTTSRDADTNPNWSVRFWWNSARTALMVHYRCLSVSSSVSKTGTQKLVWTQPSACSGHSVFMCTATVLDWLQIKSLLWKKLMYLSGHFDPYSPTGCTLSGQKCSNVGCLTLTGYSTSCFLSNQADLCSPQVNHWIMNCDCKGLVLLRGKVAIFSKIRQTQPVFLQLLKQTIFSTWDSSAYSPGCQPQCGQSLSLYFLPIESDSQLLSLVYFLLSPCAGCVKCYYRLLPLTFVSLTVTFTGNLRKTIGETSSQAILGSVGWTPWY